MRQVPVRELNQHTAVVLARVETGERIGITRNGVQIAIIEPAQPHPLTLLIESGEFRPARAALPLFTDQQVAASDSAGSDAVVADRDDRW